MAMEDRSSEILAVCLFFFVISWLAVGLRVWVRAGMLKSFGLDDWSMMATQLIYTAYLSCQLGGLRYGTGRHLKDLEEWRAEKAFSFWYFCEIFYVSCSSVLKIAIGLFLLRVARMPVHIWIIRLLMLGTGVFGGAFLGIVIFQCIPARAFWTLDPSDGKCIDSTVLIGLTYTISALNAIVDWTFGILPIFIVKDLSMDKRQKVLVAGILAFAAVGSTATIVRLPYIHTLAESHLGRNGDFLYDTADVAIWSTVEPGIGITAGCIATLRPLLQLALAKFGMSSLSPGSRHSRMPRLGGKPSNGYIRSPSTNLDGLSPARHGTVTTITGNNGPQRSANKSWHSSTSSQEQLTYPENGISKHVVVEYHSIDDARPAPPPKDEEDSVTALPSR